LHGYDPLETELEGIYGIPVRDKYNGFQKFRLLVDLPKTAEEEELPMVISPSYLV
jgi:hypothetical protein